MHNFEIYCNLSYKYRLLHAILLNYYRSYLADNKFKGKVLVACTNKKELIKNYDRIHEAINKFKRDDITTLRKFIGLHDKQLKRLFEDIDNHNVDYDTLIDNIKKEYSPNKSTYLHLKYDETQDFTKGKNIIFMDFDMAKSLYNKNNIREVFIPEKFEEKVSNPSEHESADLCYLLRLYVKEIIRTRLILKTNNARETDYLVLSVFVNTTDGLFIADELDNLMDKYIYEED